jgi:hypothetical protein
MVLFIYFCVSNPETGPRPTGYRTRQYSIQLSQYTLQRIIQTQPKVTYNTTNVESAVDKAKKIALILTYTSVI